MEIISDKFKNPSPISSTSSGLIVTPCSPQSPNSPPVSSSVATPPPVVMSPCAACKILRRRCADKCVLAPYFPPTDPLKFSIAHKVFGASNIIKLLQELPESQRADAVSSMVYEANARVRDPVYGSAGAICQLQKQVNDLQAELAKSTAQIVTLQSQHSNLLALFYMQMTSQQQSSSSSTTTTTNNDQQQLMPIYVDDDNDNDDDDDNHTSFLNFYDDHNFNFDSILEPLF